MTTPRTLVVGETLVDFLPDRPGTLADVESFAPRPGGAPANVAVAMARLGHPPGFLTRIASDDFGEVLASALAHEGVPATFVQRDPDHPTTLAFVTHDTAGDRSFTFHRSDTADEHLDTTTIADETLADVEHVVVGGVLLTTDPARTAVLDLADRARDHDCTVVFDPNARPELWPSSTDPVAVVESMLARTDVLTASVDDFAGFDYPDTPRDLAAHLLHGEPDADAGHGPHTVLLTCGRDGALAHSTADAPWGAGAWTHDGFTVDAVDTTGAGDAFLGGFLTALEDTAHQNAGDLADADPAALLAFANAVAAHTTTASGAWTALPTRDDLDGPGHDLVELRTDDGPSDETH